VAATIVLYVTLPDRFVLGPKWVLPALEASLLVPLSLTAPHRRVDESRQRRLAALALIALVNIANVASLALLVHSIVRGSRFSGHDLIYSAIQIWLTNAVVFGLWYWELDGGGPAVRLSAERRRPDFLFPQMTNPEASGVPGWKPMFFDYLYVSFTNATAFSPTDTMPLTLWAKGLMLAQSLASLITVALVAARAVNILS